MNDVSLSLEPELSADEFTGLLIRSTLAERRPVEDINRIRLMLQHADIICTARVSGLLVGVSRAITDFSYCTYLSDLAVARDYQGRGIGRRLIAETHAAAGSQTRLILIAAPAAESYYPHIGMEQHHSCWTVPPENCEESQASQTG